VNLNSSWIRWFCLALGLLALRTSGGSTELPNVALPNAFLQGEDLQFAIHWGLVTGGYSSLKVEDIDRLSGHAAYHVIAEAHSTGMVDAFYRVRDRNESWVETQSPRTVRYLRDIREGKYRIQEEVLFNQEEHRYRRHAYRIDKNTYENKEGAIPPHVMDALGSLYYVRTLPLEVGKSYTVDVHSGDQVYPLIVNVKKHQVIKVKAGKFDCLLVEPQLRAPGIFISKGKKLEVWLTADERHLPILMRSEVFIGHVSAELVKIHTVPPAETAQLLHATSAVR